jgi:hypothetical protein
MTREGRWPTPLIIQSTVAQTSVIVNPFLMVRVSALGAFIVDSVLLEAVLDTTESSASKVSCRFITTH